MVINNDFFHPLRLAQEAATVDVLTDGRLELGLGSGWSRPEYDLLGVSYDRPRVRAARLADAVRTMKRAWSGEITMPGTAESLAAVPAPLQRPHPPLVIGGHGDAILTLAAAEADIVGLTGLTWTGSALAPTGASLESLTERTAFVRAEAKTRADALECNVLV
jgi:probable F420-dependent oxidoreductase